MAQQAQGQSARPSSSMSVLVLAVAVVVILFLAGLMIVLVANQSQNDLVANLDSTVVGEGGLVFVSIYGEIANQGSQALYGIVTIRVWDGSGWQTFSEGTDLIQPQDSVTFTWMRLFEGADPSQFEVEWSVHEA